MLLFKFALFAKCCDGIWPGFEKNENRLDLPSLPAPVYPKFEVSVLGAYLKVYDIQYVFFILNFLLIISNKYCKILEAYITAFKICTVFT